MITLATPTPWLPASALAGLPGMPGTERGCRDWLQRHQVPSRAATGKRGGGVVWDCSHLPPATRRALMLQAQAQEPQPTTALAAAQPAPSTTVATRATTAVAAPAAPAAPKGANLADAAVADARAALVEAMRTLAAEQHISIKTACAQLAASIATPGAPANLVKWAGTANVRARADGAPLSDRTLRRWHQDHLSGGWQALVPAPAQAQPLELVAGDVAQVLSRFASTKGAARNLTEVCQAITADLGRPADDWRRLYDKARRALAKLPRTDLIKARHTGSDRDALLPYKRRDTKVLAFGDVWLIDGHSFKAKVRHPDHGQPFTPEVTVVIDAASRCVVGWSISLSESTMAVGDAMRHAVSGTGYPPAMLYSDLGPGETGKALDCEIDGIYARLGISRPISQGGKPQSHGLIERSWQTHMLRAARKYGSYQGGDADSGAIRRNRLELEREARAIRAARGDGSIVSLSRLVPSWAQFVADIAAEIERYNTQHRHRSLPKHTSGPHKGLHLTPAEARALMTPEVDPALLLQQAEIDHLFRPSMIRTPTRGWVRLLNQWYFSNELMAHGVDGQRCAVRYDIHDAGAVWVYALDGRFVCRAGLEANGMDYMPKPAIQLAKERRVRQAIKRLEIKAETAARELDGPPTDAGMVPVLGPADAGQPLQLVERVDAQPAPAPVPAAELAPAPAASQRPAYFEHPAERYEWLMSHPDAWADADQAWLERWVQTPQYDALATYFASRGMAWHSPGPEPSFNRAG